MTRRLTFIQIKDLTQISSLACIVLYNIISCVTSCLYHCGQDLEQTITKGPLPLFRTESPNSGHHES